MNMDSDRSMTRADTITAMRLQAAIAEQARRAAAQSSGSTPSIGTWVSAYV